MATVPDSQLARSPLVELQPYHRPAVRKIEQFVLDLGGGHPAAGRERFLACLTLTAHTDDRLDQLLLHLEDPGLAGRSIGELAIALGFRAGELLKIVKDTALLYAQTRATTILAEGLAAVTQDIVTRAQPHMVLCNDCEGTGSVTPEPTKDKPNPAPETCKGCKGRGQVVVSGDLDRQTMVMEMAKMLPKGGGTQIGIVNQQPGGQGSDAPALGLGALFSQLVAATDKIVHPERSTVRHGGPSNATTTVSASHPADASVSSSDPVEVVEAEVLSSGPIAGSTAPVAPPEDAHHGR